jgi:putative phosphoesterase
MKIGIMADSHDHRENIRKAVELFNNENVEHVIHAGDLVAPFTYDEFSKLTVPMTAVFGNNDGETFGLKKVFDTIYPAPLEKEFDSKKFLVLHEPFNLESIIAGGLFDYIIYGHSHEVDTRRGNVTVINPGEVCGWLTGKATIAIIETSTNEVSIPEL